jgi:hypothetical protein
MKRLGLLLRSFLLGRRRLWFLSTCTLPFVKSTRFLTHGLARTFEALRLL